MLHMVYHEKYEPMVVEDEDYVALLQSGEWFDNPNLDNGGIQDEIRKYEGQQKRVRSSEDSKGQEPEHKQVRRNPVPRSKSKAKPGKKEGNELLEQPQIAEKESPPKKKRGRPSKKK